jgi:hypothetical protein
MARPKGTKNIETPEKLWEIFLAYKNYVKENPIKVQDYVGKDGDVVYRDKERPLTIEGFECYCFENGIIGDLSHYFANTDNRYSNYLTICSHIKKMVRKDQIEGGMVGIYNPSITQRLNGLKEQTETDLTTKGKEIKQWNVVITDGSKNQ